MRGDAVGNAGECSDAARDDDHRVRRIRTAGNVRADVGIRLLFDFSRSLAEKLTDEFAAAIEFKFFGDDAQSAVGGDEVDGSDPLVVLDSEQQVLEKQRSARAGGGDGQVLRRLIGQVCAPKRLLSRRLSIGSAGSASQAKQQSAPVK